MLRFIAQIIFLSSLWLFLYIMFGHGVLLIILGSLKSRPVKRKDISPSVCFIIPAYNEQKDIEAKIDNTLNLSYPQTKLNIVVVSDGSSDRTDMIVERINRSKPGLYLIRLPRRRGRTEAINRALERFDADVYVISDANNYLAKNAVQELVKSFADPEVGAVTARFESLERTANPASEGLKRYWDFEQKIRYLECKTGSLSFVSGSLNAVRKGLLGAVPGDVTHDHYVPASCTQKGFRSVYEPRAVAFEYPASRAWKEAFIRGRNFLMGMNFLRELPNIIDIGKHPWFFFNLLIRKILRWFTPIILLLMLAASLLLLPTLHSLIFLALTVSAIVVTVFMILIKKPPLWISVVGFFCLSQLGLLWGIIQFIFGKRILTWEPPR